MSEILYNAKMKNILREGTTTNQTKFTTISIFLVKSFQQIIVKYVMFTMSILKIWLSYGIIF